MSICDVNDDNGDTRLYQLNRQRSPLRYDPNNCRRLSDNGVVVAGFLGQVAVAGLVMKMAVKTNDDDGGRIWQWDVGQQPTIIRLHCI